MLLLFSFFSKKVATSSLDGTVLVWNLVNHQVNKFVGHKSSVHTVEFNPSGTLIASGSSDNTVKIWENNSDGNS